MQRIGVLVTACAVCVLLAGSSPASAQERGDTGLTMAYPASVGVIWHVSDRIAVRPEMFFRVANTEDNQSVVLAETNTWTLGVGVSGIFYLREWDKLRTYVSPRYAYSKASTTSDLQQPAIELEINSSVHALSGAFGAQYSLSDKFSVFGEVGVEYTKGKGTSPQRPNQTDTSTFGSQSGVGVIFYF